MTRKCIKRILEEKYKLFFFLLLSELESQSLPHANLMFIFVTHIQSISSSQIIQLSGKMAIKIFSQLELLFTRPSSNEANMCRSYDKNVWVFQELSPGGHRNQSFKVVCYIFYCDTDKYSQNRSLKRDLL